MPAGHDFDALLMGALYGELSAVEESRLQAHLAAHPADQQIFHELTRTREAIRAGVAAAFVEPPQAISALLLQEAARRAPKIVPEASGAAEGGGRWMRWLTSLLAHPGLAAAAMLVVVVGVAGSMYLRGGAKVAETTAPMASQPAATAPSEAAAASPSGAARGGGFAMEEPSTAATAGSGAGAMQPKRPDTGTAGSPVEPQNLDFTELKQDSYSVGLDGKVDVRQADLRRANGPKSRDYIDAKPVDEIALKDFDDRAEVAKPAKISQPLAKESPEAGLEVGSGGGKRKRERSDGDALSLGDSAADGAASEQEAAVVWAAPPAAPRPELARGQKSEKGGAAVYDSEQLEAAPPKPVARSSSAAAPPATSTISSAPTAAAPVAPPPVANRKADASVESKPAPPAVKATEAPAATATGAATVDSTSDKKAIADETWAKGEHARLLRLAKANQCSEAAAVAGAIAARAPRYYQDRVATDTKLRVCQAAIRDQLNLQAEQSKRRAKAPARANEAAPAPSKK